MALYTQDNEISNFTNKINKLVAHQTAETNFGRDLKIKHSCCFPLKVQCDSSKGPQRLTTKKAYIEGQTENLH